MRAPAKLLGALVSVALATSILAMSIGTGIANASFAPSFDATSTTTSSQAGAYTTFTITVGEAGEGQPLGPVSVKLPPGVLGTLANVTQCASALVPTGACGASSRVGRASIGAGLGAGSATTSLPGPGGGEDPVYLTGPYDGAPFGLAIVLHLQTTTMNLGEVLVRAAISVDPITAQLTLALGALPSVVGGVPFELRSLSLTLDQPKFMRNPTSCASLQSLSTITSLGGETVSIPSPFEATGCANLPFDPSMAVSTSAKTTRVGGAGLYVKVVDRPGDAVAGYVKAALPRQLPARLSTLNKACARVTFEANPATCDPGARIGFAKMSTQILAGAMSGPAYLVSYGGAKFPELVIVFQAEGVTIDLHASIFIDSAGIISATFATLPDVPLHYFELTLPSGPDSALDTNGSLCAGKLWMPNTYVGENGATIHRATRIEVNGCPRLKARKRRRR